MAADGDRDWGAWSRECVRLMQARNQAFLARFGLSDQPYRWNLEEGQMAFLLTESAVVADLCAVGSVSDSAGTFLWGWANEAIPPQAKQRLHEVRGFGERHDLGLLVSPEWAAGRAEGLEMLAVAGRILDADGTWVDPQGDVTLLFTLHQFRPMPRIDVAWLTEAPLGSSAPA